MNSHYSIPKDRILKTISILINVPPDAVTVAVKLYAPGVKEVDNGKIDRVADSMEPIKNIGAPLTDRAKLYIVPPDVKQYKSGLIWAMILLELFSVANIGVVNGDPTAPAV